MGKNGVRTFFSEKFVNDCTINEKRHRIKYAVQETAHWHSDRKCRHFRQGCTTVLGKTFEFKKFVEAGSISPSLSRYIEGAGLVRAQLDFEGFSPLCAGATPKTE